MNDFRKQGTSSGNPFNSITSVILMVIALIAIFYIARFIFRILWFVAPVILIAALIVDYKTVLGYLKWVGSLFQKNPVMGIAVTVLSALGFPLVSGFLLMKGLLKKKVKEAQATREAQIKGEFVDYEEIVDDESLELPPLKDPKDQPIQIKKDPSKSQQSGNEYDHLFDQ